MPRAFEEIQNEFAKAVNTGDWTTVIVQGAELLLLDDSLSWVWINRGIALHKMGCHIDAILNYDRALALEPDNAGFHCNKGAVLFDLEKLDQALVSYKRSTDLDPTIPQAWLNIGHVHKWNGDDARAITAYKKAVEVDPEYADGQLQLGIMQIKHGDFKEGWERYEWRWKTDQLVSRGLKKPVWKGEDLSNKTILVYAEQGLGDIIQFARYARLVAQRFPKAKVIIEAKQAVKRLLQTIPEVYAVINFGEKLPDVDYVIPMMSLPSLLTPSINHIPLNDPEYYIKHEDVDAWEGKLVDLYDRVPGALKVGICWAGMSRTAMAKIDSMRSTSLDTFAPLAKIPNILWLSLQKGPPATQVQKPPALMTIGDFTEDMYDFYETCAAIKTCDLVITVDTAVAHAAASVGVETWILSRWDGCWRWFHKREDSPWYPTAKIFNQDRPHSWDSVIKQMADELLDLTLAK